jgi:hypothetical protein
MSPNERHPDKDVQKALETAAAAGAELEVRRGRGHAWGRLSCGLGGEQGCAMMIWSTPKNSHTHARAIAALIRKCPHSREEAEAAIDTAPTPANAHVDD